MMNLHRLALLVLLTTFGCGDDAAVSAPDVDASADASADAVLPDADAAEVADATPDAIADLDLADSPLEVTCLVPEAAPAGTDALTDALGTASVVVEDREACQRTYVLSSTAERRDGSPASPRRIPEQPGWPTLRSGHDLFDALYALALEEVRQNGVDQVAGTSCGEGGCFVAGQLWQSVWTRDASYAIDLGLAAIDPIRSRNSLQFKLSERRGGGDLQIVQDTGTGGSYPVSTDRVVWALGAAAVLLELDGTAAASFADEASAALVNTVEHDRRVVFDPVSGLYFGETSYLDWREQTYPSWTAHEPVDVAWSRALSTNLLHLRALELSAELRAAAEDEAGHARYASWAAQLRSAIREHLWLEDEGLFASFIPSPLDPAPVRRYDLLGSALAVVFGVADAEQADRILATYPHWGRAAPVIWPQQQVTPIYHNRAEWPFVDAYWLRAAQMADNILVGERMVGALVAGAALNLSNMENFEAGSGAPWLQDGTYSGPVVNSQRQLWSVAGYLSMVQRTLFGLEPRPDGLRVAPWIPPGVRQALFGGTDQIILNDYPFRGRRVTVVLHMPEAGPFEVAARELNGAPIEGDVLPMSQLLAANRVDVWLELASDTEAPEITDVSDDDWRDVFGPRTPYINGISDVGGDIQLVIGETDDAPADFVLHVYRDGVRVAEGLPGTTTTWTDTEADPGDAPCYALEATFVESGNHSQHARAVCWWGAAGEDIATVPAIEFEASGGDPIENHGRFHYQNWGDVGDVLEADFEPDRGGAHLLQVLYGNGSGPINTGITCGVKALRVETAGGEVVAEGFLAMPQLNSWGRWELSTVVPVELVAGESYHIVIHDDPAAVNMSAFAHFATYGGSGGAEPFNRVNIAELRVLRR